MEIDKEKVKKRFSEINEALAEIRRLVSLPEKNFWAEKENMAAVKYYLLQAIEGAGSVCVHVAAKKFSHGVSAFGECFEVLGKEKALSQKLVTRLRKMAKFRNKLIHQYWETDNRNIFDYAKKDLVDFEDFMREIGKII
jgi:uncharacterized protein YutE (UPF0331/DUF86 family)